ncbi:MAG: sugar ABC transporter ATP-binding protein [Fimbriimonas sp.]|nr:sugar ABC transporter ATP-binding protein [Fimbriimonas sp.]
MSSALLEMRGIDKSFPGVKALDSVDFTLRSGEIHALMGENGAGKSTLIKVLTGVFPKDGGSIALEGKLIHPRTPLHAQTLGISTVYQEVNLVPTLSVAENIFLGREPTRFGSIQWRRMKAASEQALAKLDIQINVGRLLSSYSIAIQQMVAIARAVEIEAQVLVLDEPTSSLDKDEVRQLFAVMQKLKSQGLGILFVSHFLDQVFEVSDRITILRNGRLVGERQTSSITRLQLVSMMIGKSEDEVAVMASHNVRDLPTATGEPFLTATGLTKRGSVGPVDLQVRKGEVVGLAGLLGSGRTETAQIIFGVEHPDQGTIHVEGQPVRISNPRKAIRLGFGFLSEDRKMAGIIPNLSIRENIVLALQANRGWLRKISQRQQQELADRYIKALKIATPDADKPISQLSGGNQQKVLLARWLASQPKLLILDEPTRGVDVGAKAEIEGLVYQMCADGMAILFISSELDELLRDSSRLVVMRDRKKVGELSGDRLNSAELMNTIAAGGNER